VTSMIAKVKEVLLKGIINSVIWRVTRDAKKDPDGTLRKLILKCRRFTRDDVWRSALDGLLSRLDNNHPGMGVARKFFTQLNPTVRKKLTETLIIKETLLGPNYRHRIERELGYYPPSTFVISPTMYCPLNCYGCYAGSYTQDESLSFDEVDSIIEQAKKLGIHFIVISGGEPYTWPHLFDIFEKHRDVFFQTFTNGLFIDDKAIEKIATLGNVSPAISCEGFEKETDARRGKGAFKKVNEVMDEFKRKGVFFTFSATASRQNLDVVTSEEFVDYWIEKGCLVGWYFIYIPIGRGPLLELMPTPQQRVEMSRRIKRFRSTKEIFLIDFWNDGEHTRGCIAGGRKYFHINNKGDAEPCVFCHFATDNIKEKPLKEILNCGIFKAIKDRQPYNPDYRRPCILIDNPQVLREVVSQTGACPTHKGAESLITDFADEIDRYASEFGEALKDGPTSMLSKAI